MYLELSFSTGRVVVDLRDFLTRRECLALTSIPVLREMPVILTSGFLGPYN
jgi:hypothetical protein